MTDRIGSFAKRIGSCGSFFYWGDRSKGSMPMPIWTKPISKIRNVLNIYQGLIGQCI